MIFSQLIEKTAELMVFSPGMVTAGEDLDQVRVQLSRWARNGRIARVHKGWYALNEPYRRLQIDLNVIGCTIKAGSYVSLQSALAVHGLIPEFVAETSCVTTGRPQTVVTPFGRISYRHIKREAFFGYRREGSGPQSAYIAQPEKGLLDLLYLTPDSYNVDYLAELRLQNLDSLEPEQLRRMAARFGSPKLERAATEVVAMIANARGR